MKNTFREVAKVEALVKIAEVKKELMDLRFKMVLSHVERPIQKRILRRQIARLNTIITEFDRGIRKI